MPIYEFECRGCQARFEKLCGFGADGVTCPNCAGGDVKRLISSFYSRSSGSSDSSASASSCGGCRKTSCAGCR